LLDWSAVILRLQPDDQNLRLQAKSEKPEKVGVFKII
jgi:hypothetical protein